MRKMFLTAAAAMLVATPAFADEWDFVLTNNTGKEIKLVEVAPTGTQTWQKNVVDAEVKKETTTKPGARMTVHFDKGAGCKYDIRATFADDTTMVWTGFNTCDDSYITVKISPAGAPTFTGN